VTREQAIQLADLERLRDTDAPDLASAIAAFLEQGEPERTEPLPDDAMTLDALRAALAMAARRRDKEQRQVQAHEAWKRYLAQPADRIAPQMSLADLIVALYERNTPGARAAMLLVASEAPLVFGVWGGLKRVFKRAEKDLDAEVFAALAVRFDLAAAGLAGRTDVGRGTLIYVQRRAARWMRLLGKASLELYPDFAVEVLRRYPPNVQPWSATVAGRITSGSGKKWGAPVDLPKEKRFRAPYLEAWKKSPEPLMVLLETCQSDMAASFAILGLRELHPEMFRHLSTEWLARLAYRPLAAAHEFLVDLLEGSPQLHQGNIAALGLKEAVLRLLTSPSAKARKYAIDYARGQAADMPTERLIDLLEEAGRYQDTIAFVVSLLKARGPARSLGLVMLGRLLRFDASRAWAAASLEGEFDKREITEDFLADALFDDHDAPPRWARQFIEGKLAPTELPVGFWIRLLEDPRLREHAGVGAFACTKLALYPITSVAGDWLLAAIGRDDIGPKIAAWLEKAEALPPSLDLERIRGLVFDPAKRQVAFTILGNPKIVAPRDVGIPWLLSLARRADASLHEWAHRYLLTHVKPDQFAEGKPSVSSGVAHLFALASAPKQPEAMRAFAQLYLRCHHPKLGKREAETKEYGIKPAVPRDAYTEERVWPCLLDLRADVRRFGVAIARAELRRWGAAPRVYELAESSAKEVRNLAYDALFQAGEPDADPDLAVSLDELDAAQIFSMTESRRRPTRDAGMDLIRKHYARLGGAERLGWLMQSADREVRLFAVRLLWEKHRPRGIPSTWRPPEGKSLETGEAFKDAEALRALLRRLLFMVPPPRSNEALDKARAKKLPASVAKQHVIEVVRDLGVADAGFAQIVAPVLGEFTGSVAKGEWQACLAALLRLRDAHGLAVEGMV
jgi:hypothetical protein